MSTTPIETPADLLRLTHEIDDVRYMTVARQLGHGVLIAAAEQDALTDEILEGLSTDEVSQFFWMEEAGTEASPVVQVDDANRDFDAELFTAAIKADTDHSLGDYHFESVFPGKITISNRRREAVRLQATHYSITAIIPADAREMILQKKLYTGMISKKVEDAPTDQDMIYRAARLLSAQLAQIKQH